MVKVARCDSIKLPWRVFLQVKIINSIFVYLTSVFHLVLIDSTPTLEQKRHLQIKYE